MEINETFIIDSMGLPGLTSIARQAADMGNLALGPWRINQIAGGVGNPVSVGLYRVEGSGRAGGEIVPWSAILKVIQSPGNLGQKNIGEGEDQTHWNYWKRELLLYQSDLLQTLPAGLAAPRFYGATEIPGNIACLWLEEIVDDYQDMWPLERYALAARHLGRLNGMGTQGHSSVRYPWLARQRLRQWRDFFPEWQWIPWQHPLVRARYPDVETVNMRRLLQDSEAFLLRLEQLPHTLCHGDTYPTNFKSRHAAGVDQTVALDWGLAHVGPVGYDLGLLTFGAYINLADSDLAEIDRSLFAAYMAGLRDSDYEGNPTLVRFGYAASVVLIAALFLLAMLYYDIQQGQAPAEEDVAPAGHRPSFEGAMADIAYEMLDSIR